MYQITHLEMKAYKKNVNMEAEILTSLGIIIAFVMCFLSGASTGYHAVSLVGATVLSGVMGRTYILDKRAKKAAARFSQKDLEHALLPFLKHTLLELSQTGDAGEKTLYANLLKKEKWTEFEFVTIGVQHISGLTRRQETLLKKGIEDVLLESHQKAFRHATVRLTLDVSFNDALSAHQRVRFHQETQDIDTGV